jgi:hypothetical protein
VAAPPASPARPVAPKVATASPPTSSGSLAPGVYYRDITYTLRANFFRATTVSHHDPNVAYVASWDGYVWKTTDGGKTWDESRLIVEQRGYFGDGWQKLYFGVHRSSDEAWSPKHLDGAPDGRQTYLGRTGKLGLRPGVLRRYGAPQYEDLSRMRFAAIDAESAGRAGAAGNVNFGVGLPGRAPRLQLVVRKFGKPTSGLNIKQTLLLRGLRPTEVRIVVIHPKNPNVVFACTMFGLYMTYDGGLNWVRTFQGVNPRGRMIFHVAIDPSDEKRVLLGTGDGMYVSTDGGENYIKSTSQGVGDGVIDWIYFNPYDSRYVFVGTDYGLLRSTDSGITWDWIYFTTFPPARVVRSIVIDPFDRRTGYIATHDGIFVTPDLLGGDLESWRPLGGLRFSGMEVPRIIACPKHKGHLWTMTNMKIASVNEPGTTDTGGAFIWESTDGGTDWRVIYSGNTQGSIQWIESDPVDPDLLWVTWSRSLARMVRKQDEPKRQVPKERIEQALRLLRDGRYPPVADVIIAGLRYTGSDPEMMLKYRRLSRFRALIPRVDAQYYYYRWNDYPLLQSGIYPTLPFYGRATRNIALDEFRLMFTWDLSSLVFNLSDMLFGRVDRMNQEIREMARYALHRYYAELKRLRFMLMIDPPADFRVRLMYNLRIEELESYINYITGGYLKRYDKGDRPSGWNTPKFEPWTGPGPARTDH